MTPWNSVFFPFEKRRFLPWAFFSALVQKLQAVTPGSRA